MAKNYTGTLSLEWYNKQKSILLQAEENARNGDIPAPKINWVNKEESLFYEIDENQGKGIKPYWVDRNDIRVKEARPLIFKKAFKAVPKDVEGSLQGMNQEWTIKEIDDENDAIDIENILIKGDNLLALNALKKHFDKLPDEKKVKCIYIDPPYNTGSAFQHYDDNFVRSEWLTLMRDRLLILREIMKSDGVIFINIDDLEQAYLKVLLDEIFGSENFICNFIWESRSGQGNTSELISEGHEYILCYAKEIEKVNFKKITNIIENGNYSDEISEYKREQLRQWGEQGDKRENRPSMFFPIIRKDNIIDLPPKEEIDLLYDSTSKIFRDDYLNDLKRKYESLGFDFILPQQNTIYKRWRTSYDSIKMLIDNNGIDIVIDKTGEFNVYKKIRIGKTSESTYSTLLFGLGTATKGTNDLKSYFGEKVFDTPKPENLINHLLYISTDENDLVLDCFAGSGTTGVVAQKMKRRWILIEIGNSVEFIEKRLLITLTGKSKLEFIHKLDYLGGGSFKYYHLGESIIKFSDGNTDFNWDLDVNFIMESFLHSYDYQLIDNSFLTSNELFEQYQVIPKIGIQTIGSRNRIAIITLQKPDEKDKLVTYDELMFIYTYLDKQYKPDYINVFTNRGVNLAFDSKPQNLEIIKIPQAIISELEK